MGWTRLGNGALLRQAAAEFYAVLTADQNIAFQQNLKTIPIAVVVLVAGTVKLSRIRPFCGRILLDQRLRINDLAVAASGENAAKLLNLTVPS